LLTISGGSLLFDEDEEERVSLFVGSKAGKIGNGDD
jgi:hypothetical protein